MDRAGDLRWYCDPILDGGRWLHWCSKVLSPSECARAGRYTSERAALRFRSSHGALRGWLAGQLNLDPRALTFAYSGTGKPMLDSPACAFSFAHTDTHWAAALDFASTSAIGIDIESIGRFAVLDAAFAAHVLSAEEFERWRALDDDEAVLALARVWTRKEALLKAIGVGLRRPMQALSVGWAHGPLRVVAADAGGVRGPWIVHDLQLSFAGLVGALVQSGGAPGDPLFSAGRFRSAGHASRSAH